MAIRMVHHNGQDHTVGAYPSPCNPGKYNATVDGQPVAPPRIPSGGNVLPVDFDTEQAALDAGEDNVKMRMFPP